MLDFLMSAAGWILENPVQFGTSVVTIASAIAAITPSTKDDKVVEKARKVVDVLALNVGHAKTSKPEKKGPRQ